MNFQRTDGQGHRVDLRVRQHCDSSLELKLSKFPGDAVTPGLSQHCDARQSRKLRPTQNSKAANSLFSKRGDRLWASRAPRRANTMLVRAIPSNAGR